MTAHARPPLPPRPSIPRGEYAGRRAAVRLAAQQAGLDGLVAWSAGGSTLDRYASVFYLTNHYDAGNVFPDVRPLFTGFGMAALVLPADGESILVVNQPDWRDDLGAADRVWVRRDLYGGVAEALVASGLDRGILGLTDEERMSITALRAIEHELPSARFLRADELLMAQRMVKSPAEIEMMRYASAVSVELLNAMFA